MTTRIRGKKRTQIIEKWLKGVEDPDVEVKPTKNKERYIVKAKNKDSSQAEPTQNEPDDVEPAQNEAVEEEEIKAEPAQNEAKPNIKQNMVQEPDEYTYEYEYEEEEQPDVNLSIQMEILNQLRAMQEEKRLRQEEKQRNKQIKEQVQHQLYKQRRQLFVEPEPVRENSLTPQRRRLNLLKRYS